jgi:hypothetical protein
MQVFIDKLTAMFESVEPAFREETVKRYRAAAAAQLKYWLTLLEGPEPQRGRNYWEETSVPQYVVTTAGSYSPSWQSKVDLAKQGKWVADYVRAERDANNSVDDAKLHFIAKQSKKLANATKLHKGLPTLTGSLKLNVVIEGHLLVSYKNGDGFRLEMSMIVNHRYQRGCTTFYQFPARFKDVCCKAELPKGNISEKWMSENFK